MQYLDLNITQHLPPITNDYINNKKSVKSLYNRFFEVGEFHDQIEEKKKNYDNVTRKSLCDVLSKNYTKIKNNSIQINSINDLKKSNSFTVTTGHQLNLFTGPLYFFYKIIDTIKICEKLKSKYPGNNFFPIYWMASEDHDFEEISYFNTSSNKFFWDIKTNGRVGKLKTNSLKKILDEISLYFGKERFNSKKITELFKKTYLKHKNLASATFHLVHEIFGKYGLLILDADDRALKKLIFKEFVTEITNQSCFESVSSTNQSLIQNKFKPQVNPREINLFFLGNNSRKRIIKIKNKYSVLESRIKFSQKQLIDEITNYPERFSPNVLLRTIYQEKILPNLAYVGGGSEIAYWLQLRDFFKINKITFPILKVRSSLLLISKKNQKKCEKLNISISDLFKSKVNLELGFLKNSEKYDFDLTNMKTIISKNFQKLHQISKKTDKSFLGALKAQEKKQIKGIENLEKRLIKAEKRNKKDKLKRLNQIRDELFPNNNLQERELNFSEFYQYQGDKFIDTLFKKIDPFNNKFLVITL